MATDPAPTPLAESTAPGNARFRAARRRLPLRGELLLALLPTATVLVVLALVEALTQQRLLFASLASSAFLIYLDPTHGMNGVRALALSQLLAAVVGFALFAALGAGYWTAGLAMVVTIVVMIVLDAVHPPAVATAMSFALRAEDASNLLLFGLALGITACLVVLQRAAVWGLARLQGGMHRTDSRGTGGSDRDRGA
jgi:CBS-domain-containing membrane protein